MTPSDTGNTAEDALGPSIPKRRLCRGDFRERCRSEGERGAWGRDGQREAVWNMCFAKGTSIYYVLGGEGEGPRLLLNSTVYYCRPMDYIHLCVYIH